MKKLIMITVMALGLVLYAQPVSAPIVLSPTQTVVKIDDKTYEITTTYVQRKEKEALLERKQRCENDIAHANAEIDRIDKILEIFK